MKTVVEWRDIPDLIGYQVSSHGQVRTFWRYCSGRGRGARRLCSDGKIMRAQTTPSGHKRLILGRGDQRSDHLIHRLVLIAFRGPCPTGMVACHNNGIPADNRIENLRWDTPSNNTKDSVRHGTHRSHRGEAQSHSVLTECLVREIRKTSGQVSQYQWARRIGCSRSLIGRVRSGQSWAWVE